MTDLEIAASIWALEEGYYDVTDPQKFVYWKEYFIKHKHHFFDDGDVQAEWRAKMVPVYRALFNLGEPA